MVANRLFTIISTMLSLCWKFFQLPFPTTNIPIGAILVLPTVVGFAVRFLRNFFGVGGVGQVPSTLKSYDKIDK